MNQPLFSIGSYASATGLSASALRFYADAGLLIPDHVDERTGYRYYSSDSVDRARLVSRLRSAGTPMEVLRLVIDSEPAEAAHRLEILADEREADGARTTELIRSVAAELRRPEPTEPTVGVDGLELAAALAAAARFVDSEPPFDRISLIAGEGAALEVVATDRFRFSCHRVGSAVTVHGSGRAGLSPEHVADAIRWLHGASREIELTIGSDLVMLGPDDRRLELPRLGDHLPDHHELIAPPSDAATRVELDRRSAVDAATGADELVTVSIHDQDVRLGDRTIGRTLRSTTGPHVTLTASLLTASLAALPGELVIMEWHDPQKPVHLRSPLTPHWRTVIMPARTD